MKVTVKKSDLTGALKLTSKAKEKTSPLVILEDYLIHVKKNTMTVCGGSLTTRVELDIKAESEDTFSFMLEETQAKLIEKLGDYIQFDFSDRVLELTSGKDKSKNCPSSHLDYPIMEKVNNDNPFIINDINGFSEKIAKAKKFTLNDDLRPALCGINMKFENFVLQICATDAHKLYVGDISISHREGQADNFIINDTVATIISAIKNVQTLHVSKTEKYVLFEINGKIRIQSKVIDERYPDYMTVIPDNKQLSKMDKKQLLLNIDKAKLFANKTTNQISFKFSENNVLISAEDMDYSREFSATMDSENKNFENGSMRIGFNAVILTSILKELDSPTVEIQTSLPTRAATFKTKDEIYLIMPIMLAQ